MHVRSVFAKCHEFNFIQTIDPLWNQASDWDASVDLYDVLQHHFQHSEFPFYRNKTK